MLRRDNDNNEVKRTEEQTLQQWTELQTAWDGMSRHMSFIEQLLFPLDEESAPRHTNEVEKGNGGYQLRTRKKKLLSLGFQRP